MQEIENPSLDEIRRLLESSQDLHFHAERCQKIYGWVDGTLRQHNYNKLGRADKGTGAALRDEDDRAEPRTSGEVDRPVRQEPCGARDALPQASIRAALRQR